MRLGLALSLKTMERTEQVIDVFHYVTQHLPHIFQDGRWQIRPLGKDRTIIDPERAERDMERFGLHNVIEWRSR